jgi:hypothetical protein
MIEGVGEIVIRRPAAAIIEFVTDLEHYKQARRLEDRPRARESPRS